MQKSKMDNLTVGTSVFQPAQEIQDEVNPEPSHHCSH